MNELLPRLSVTTSQDQPPVYVAAVADCCDGDDVSLVVYGVDDPVVTYPYPHPRRVALEGFSACGPRVGGERAHLGQHVTTGRGVELSQSLTDA